MKKINELDMNRLVAELNKKLLYEVVDKIFKLKNKKEQ